jgi:four helix bundle protein
MAALASYENIKAWQKSHLLALEVYKATNKFPREEAFGLVSQLRRAAISTPTNIAEGYARQNQKVFGTFLDTAYASLVEVKYLLKFSYEVGYLPMNDFNKLESLSDEVGKILWGYMKEVKNR